MTPIPWSVWVCVHFHHGALGPPRTETPRLRHSAVSPRPLHEAYRMAQALIR